MGLIKDALEAIIRIDRNIAEIRKVLTWDRDAKLFRATYMQKPIELVRADSDRKNETGLPLFDRLHQLKLFPYPDQLTFGGRIKAVRMFKDLTQKEFGDSIGVTFGHISNLEKDITQPSAMLIRSISMRFKIDERWLATGHLPQTTEEPATPIHLGKIVPLSGYDEGKDTIRETFLRAMPKEANLRLDSESGRDYSQSAQ